MEKTQTYLIGRNNLFRQGLRSLLKDSPFEITAESASLTEATIAENNPPELVIMDLSLDTELAVERVREVGERLPGTPLVVLTESLSTRHLAACLEAGANGYLIKDISCDALLQSLRLVMLGEKVFPTHLATQLVNGTVSTLPTPTHNRNNHGLSEREMQIIQCLVQGESNKMIANRLNIAEATVKVHMKTLLRKINAANRTQAAIWALDNGITSQAAQESRESA